MKVPKCLSLFFLLSAKKSFSEESSGHLFTPPTPICWLKLAPSVSANGVLLLVRALNHPFPLMPLLLFLPLLPVLEPLLFLFCYGDDPLPLGKLWLREGQTWNLPAFPQLWLAPDTAQTQDAVQGDLSAGLGLMCCKRPSIAHQVAGTEVRGLNLVGLLNSMPQVSRGNRTGLVVSVRPGSVVLSKSRAYLGLLSFLICKSKGSVLIWKDSHWRAFFIYSCCNPTVGKATQCWERGGQPRFQGAGF